MIMCVVVGSRRQSGCIRSGAPADQQRRRMRNACLDPVQQVVAGCIIRPVQGYSKANASAEPWLLNTSPRKPSSAAPL